MTDEQTIRHALGEWWDVSNHGTGDCTCNACELNVPALAALDRLLARAEAAEKELEGATEAFRITIAKWTERWDAAEARCATLEAAMGGCSECGCCPCCGHSQGLTQAMVGHLEGCAIDALLSRLDRISTQKERDGSWSTATSGPRRCTRSRPAPCVCEDAGDCGEDCGTA